MMGAPFKITLLSDVGQFLKGTADVEKGLDDVADSLDKLATDTKANADKAGDALTREFTTAFDKVKTESKTAGRKIGDDMHDGARKAKDGIEELGDEANQTAREAAASFDGSAESIMDAFQEVAANAFAGFGPAGALAGLAAAAGIGLVFSSLQTAAEKANEARERVSELARELLTVKGNPAALQWADKLADKMLEITNRKEWYEFWEADNGPGTRLEEWSRKAQEFGLDMTDVYLSQQGDTEALTRVQEQLNAEYERRNALIERGSVTADNSAMAQGAEDARNLANEIGKGADETQRAAELAKLLADPYIASLDAAREASEDFSESLTDHLSVADEGLSQFVHKGKLSIDEYAKAVQTRAKEVQLVEDFAIEIIPQLSPATANHFASLEVEAQIALAKAFKDGSKSDRKKLITTLDAEAKIKNVDLDTSGAQAEANKTPIEVPTTVIETGALKGAQSAANNAQGVANKPSNIIEFKTKLNSSGLQGDVNRAAAGITAPTIWATVKVRKEVP